MRKAVRVSRLRYEHVQEQQSDGRLQSRLPSPHEDLTHFSLSSVLKHHGLFCIDSVSEFV